MPAVDADRATLQRELTVYGASIRSSGEIEPAIPLWLRGLSDEEIGLLLQACGDEGVRRGAAAYWWETGDLPSALPGYRP